LGEAFAGAEVGAEQTLIGVEDADQGDAREVMPLGEHLRAEQDARRALRGLAQQILQTPLAARAVAVDADGGHAREVALQRLLDTLGAGADGAQVGGAAVRTLRGERLLAAAVVTAQLPVTLVQGQVRVAAPAFADPATIVA